MLISISGLIGCGKGTVADILEKNYGFIKLSFADSLKDAISNIFGWDRRLLEGDTEQSRKWRETIDEWWANRLNMPELTPRLILQIWGTEVCRYNFHQDIWIASLDRKIMNLIKENNNINIVIPDARFENELRLIKSINGQTWRVKRGDDPIWFTNYINGGDPPKDIHHSEWNWAKSKFDFTIINNDTLDDLSKTVSEYFK